MLAATMLTLLLASTNGSRGSDYEINWFAIGPAAGVSSVGPYELRSSIGQAGATGRDALAAGPYTLTGGFLAVVSAPSCVADFTGDGTLDFFDVQLFLQAFSNNAPAADLTGDGLFTFFDIQLFLQSFSNGCP